MVEYYNLSGTQYLFFSQRLTWDEARVLCRNYNAKLAILDTMEKATSVAESIANSNIGKSIYDTSLLLFTSNMRSVILKILFIRTFVSISFKLNNENSISYVSKRIKNNIRIICSTNYIL